MKTSSFSIVVGNRACNMNCPFCVSKMTQTEMGDTEPNWYRFYIACDIAEKAADGLISVLLTGKGEPTLYPNQITTYLHKMGKRFPLVDLQTNGLTIAKDPDMLKHLEIWRDLGLTLVCVSVADRHGDDSSRIMGGPDDYDYWEAVDKIKGLGLACRINCTMTRDGLDGLGEVWAMISKCKSKGVDQLTLRSVARPETSISPEAAKWVDDNKPYADDECIYKFLSSSKELLRLPHGASIFDVDGQNVCVNNCLTQDTNPNNIRQIIFFPDGRISYDWCYPGARIL